MKSAMKSAMNSAINSTMRSFRYQKGLSSLGWLLTLMAGGFFLMSAFKLLPAYSENRYIVSALVALAGAEENFAQMTKSEIKNNLGKFYLVNNVRAEGANNIEVVRSNKKTLVNINYEVRTPLFYNIDVVLTFDNQLDSANPEKCCKPQSE